MRDKTPSVAADALAQLAREAGHEINTYPERLVIHTDAGTLRVTWGGGTSAEWTSSDGPADWKPVTLSHAARLIGPDA